jgi:hypothetical protein
MLSTRVLLILAYKRTSYNMGNDRKTTTVPTWHMLTTYTFQLHLTSEIKV